MFSVEMALAASLVVVKWRIVRKVAARISVDSLTKGMRKLKFKRYKFKKASKLILKVVHNTNKVLF